MVFARELLFTYNVSEALGGVLERARGFAERGDAPPVDRPHAGSDRAVLA